MAVIGIVFVLYLIIYYAVIIQSQRIDELRRINERAVLMKKIACLNSSVFFASLALEDSLIDAERGSRVFVDALAISIASRLGISNGEKEQSEWH